MKCSAFFAHTFALFAVKLKKPYYIPKNLSSTIESHNAKPY
jgi:hypothetical protein